MRTLWICAAFALPLAAQHDASGEGKPKHPAMGNPQAIAAGKKLYTNGCAGCHGVTGQGGRGPNLRQRGVWHPLDDDALFATIKKGIPGGGMPPTALPEEQTWQLAAFVRSLTAPAIDGAVNGDASAGEALFWGKGNCHNCHRIQGRGGALGPDLGNIGATRAAEDIRQSILDPDADGFARYRGVTVTRKDGQTLKGVARNHTNYSLQLQLPDGNLQMLQMADVKSVVFSPNSPMPRNYKDRLTPAELDNLVAYLSRQSVRPADRK